MGVLKFKKRPKNFYKNGKNNPRKNNLSEF